MTRWALLLAMAVNAPGAYGQTVRGQVRDSISGRPVDRGYMVLLSEQGEELARVLTSTEGQFVLPTPGPGTYRIRSERIGYRVWETTLDLHAAEMHDVTPLVQAIPRQLATIHVSDRTSCTIQKGPDTELLWEEARKALAAAAWIAKRDVYVHRLHTFDRDLNTDRDRVEFEHINVNIVSTELPFVSEDPATLSERGYVVERDDGEWWWWGLDVDVLLDTHFHETHCFRAVRGEADRTGLIGLAFEPTPERTVPEVEGTLWLDEASGELRDVEYRYANLPTSVHSDQIGGRTDFYRMPSGAWITQRWRIRLPIIERRRRGRPRLAGLHDIGGAVLDVVDPNGSIVYQAPGMVFLRGTVTDSTQGGHIGIDDAVTIVGTEYADEVDSLGRFQMHVLLDGPYQVTTRRLEWLGYRAGRVKRVFTPGDTVDVELIIPSLETVHRDLCTRSDPTTNLAIHGDVRTSTERFLKGAKVVVRWEPGVEREFKTDTSGRYVFCDLPANVPITLTVSHDDYNPVTVELRFVGRDVIVQTASGQTSHYIPDRIARLGLKLEAPTTVQR
jgi:Carboxypeptidase regulatory-like domain